MPDLQSGGCGFESRPGLLGYFAPRSTQPSIPPGSVNEYQLRLGRQRQIWLIPIADERVGVQVKLWNPLRTCAIPERFCGGDSLRRGAILSVCTFTFTFTFYPSHCILDTSLCAATSAVWWSWRCQTAAPQTCICLTVDVLETTINQLTTTYSQVVYQSPLDHNIVSGSSSSINSCWCRRTMPATSSPTANRLRKYHLKDIFIAVVFDVSTSRNQSDVIRKPP